MPVPTDRSQAQRAAKRQARGRLRMEQVLDVAEAAIAEVGYDATTTNLIAERAGMSPGSLYKYFANKQAIVGALADRYTQHLADTIDEVFTDDLAGLALPDLVDRVVDPVLTFNLAHPAASTLLAGTGISPELAEAAAALHAALCDRVEDLIGAIAPDRTTRDRHRTALVTFQAFAGVLPLVLAAAPAERRALTRELKTLIASYWASLVRG